MNLQPSPPQSFDTRSFSTLATHAVFVSLSIRLWNKKQLNKLLDKTHSPEQKEIINQWTREMIALQNLAFKIRMFHMRNTFPWHSGLRLLPKRQWKTYTTRIGAYQQQFDTLRLNLERSAIPMEIPGNCSVLLSLYPLPIKGDWRLQLPDTEMENQDKLKLWEQIACLQYGVHQAAYRLIIQAAERLSREMQKDPHGKGNGLRERTLSKIKEECQLVQDMEFENPLLDSIIQRLISLIAKPFESLAQDLACRQEIAGQAKDLADTLKACLLPSPSPSPAPAPSP